MNYQQKKEGVKRAVGGMGRGGGENILKG